MSAYEHFSKTRVDVSDAAQEIKTNKDFTHGNELRQQEMEAEEIPCIQKSCPGNDQIPKKKLSESIGAGNESFEVWSPNYIIVSE